MGSLSSQRLSSRGLWYSQECLVGKSGFSYCGVAIVTVVVAIVTAIVIAISRSVFWFVSA